MAWKTVKIGDFLKRTKAPVNIEDDKEYTLVTIKMNHKGVVPRGKKMGSEIGSKTMYRVRSGQFILSGIDARHGAFGVIPEILDGAVVTNDFWYFDLDEKIVDTTFFYYLTSASGFIRLCRNSSDGTTNRIRLQKDKFFSQEILIPDIESQRSLVEKLKSLSNDIGILESINENSLEKIKLLRSSIIQDAIQGKLLQQDPSEEPASILLEYIRKAKEELVKTGKIKKQKELPPISLKEMPFELPKGWEWVRLGNIGLIGSSNRIHQSDWTNEGVPFYRAREIVRLSKEGLVANELFISESLYEKLSASTLPVANDIMITGVGTIGIPYIVKEGDRFYFKDASVLIFKNLHKFNAEYLRLIMESPYWVEMIHKESMGTTVHTFTIVRANEIPIPIPPASEQSSIVEKVGKLMTGCDKLEMMAKKSEEEVGRLLESVLGKIFDH